MLRLPKRGDLPVERVQLAPRVGKQSRSLEARVDQKVLCLVACAGLVAVEDPLCLASDIRDDAPLCEAA